MDLGLREALKPVPRYQGPPVTRGLCAPGPFPAPLSLLCALNASLPLPPHVCSLPAGFRGQRCVYMCVCVHVSVCACVSSCRILLGCSPGGSIRLAASWSCRSPPSPTPPHLPSLTGVLGADHLAMHRFLDPHTESDSLCEPALLAVLGKGDLEVPGCQGCSNRRHTLRGPMKNSSWADQDEGKGQGASRDCRGPTPLGDFPVCPLTLDEERGLSNPTHEAFPFMI